MLISMATDTFVEYTFVCYICKKKVQGISPSRGSLALDNDCYDCKTPWEKVIVTRKVSDGKKED
jgi:hypothetical protein